MGAESPQRNRGSDGSFEVTVTAPASVILAIGWLLVPGVLTLLVPFLTKASLFAFI